MTDTFCIDDDVMLFAFLTTLDNVIDQLLLIIVIFLRNQNVLSTVGNTAPQSNISCTTSHNLDDTASLMRSGSITYFINCFHCCVYSCIKSDGIFCTCNVKVDCSRKTDCIDSEIRKLLSTCEGSVTTDDNKSVNSMFSADLCSTFLAFFCTEFCTTCCIKDCTSTLDCIRYIFCAHVNDLFV